MGKRALRQFEQAMSKDNTLVDSPNGHTTEYLAYLGLDKQALKTLERQGILMRGYTKNIYLPGEVMPNGATALPGSTYRDKGHSVRWVVVSK